MSALGFPEGTDPMPTDAAERSLQKINSLLAEASGPAGLPGGWTRIVISPAGSTQPDTITYYSGADVVLTLSLSYDTGQLSEVNKV